MKKLSYILFALLLGAGALFATGYFYRVSGSESYVLVDITDLKAEQIDAAAVARLSLGGVHKWGSAIVHVSTITNFDYNEVQTVTLPASFILLANPQQRQAQIDSYSAGVIQAIGRIYRIDSGRLNSSIYIPLVRCLTALSQSKAHDRALYLASDLFENIDTFSLYNPADIGMIRDHPDRVARLLEREAPIPDLSGITIYLLYHPRYREREDEQRHLLMANLLKSLFTAHHATVIIGLNLPTS